MTYSEFLQRYQYDPVADRIGKGGFGVVFKAYDTHLDRYVAIKMSEVDDENDSMRLSREVDLAAKLPTHPNIAHYEACYTFATPTGLYDFGILQFYNEGSLNDILSKGLNMAQKTSILTQILDGIDFLHSHNVVHRDLKPRNILIARRGNEFIPKITDFGMSKEFEEGNSSRFGNSITGAGTLAYASPEQLGEKQMRRNTDLWSFGVIAFQLFTEELPFNSGSHPATSSAGRIELFRQINSGELPATINTIPEPWQQLIRRLIVVDPEARLRTCADARKVLIGDFANSAGNTASSETFDDETKRENPHATPQDDDETTRENPQDTYETKRENQFDSASTTESTPTADPLNCTFIFDPHIPDLSTPDKRLKWCMKILGQAALITIILITGAWLYGSHEAYSGWDWDIYGSSTYSDATYYPSFFWIALHFETMAYFFFSFMAILLLQFALARREKPIPFPDLRKRRITEYIIYAVPCIVNVFILYFNLYIHNDKLVVILSLLDYIVLYLPYIDTPKKRIIFGILAGGCILQLIGMASFIYRFWHY